jgi:hypothetical protein
LELSKHENNLDKVRNIETNADTNLNEALKRQDKILNRRNMIYSQLQESQRKLRDLGNELYLMYLFIL